MASVWVVRAGRRGESAEEWREAGVCAIGWNEAGDFTGLARREQFLARIEKTYPTWKPGRQLNSASQLHRFVNEIAQGDFVAVPISATRETLLGRVEGSYRHEPSLVPENPNVRPVKWMRTVSRDELSVRARNYAGSTLAVFLLDEHREEFLKLAEMTSLFPESKGEKGEAAVAFVEEVEGRADAMSSDRPAHLESMRWSTREEDTPEHAISALRLQTLRRLALRHSLTPDETDDLLQDVLLAALEQGRDFNGASFLAWASGVLRRHAMFVARTAGRRRRREAAYAAAMTPVPVRTRRLPKPFIDSLPPSLQTMALLANAGLGRHEIAALLRISDTALRQRISALRRVWKRSGATIELLAFPPEHSLPSGACSPSVKTTLARLPEGRFAVADPDGHPVYLSSAHTSPRRGN